MAATVPGKGVPNGTLGRFVFQVLQHIQQNPPGHNDGFFHPHEVPLFFGLQ